MAFLSFFVSSIIFFISTSVSLFLYKVLIDSKLDKHACTRCVVVKNLEIRDIAHHPASFKFGT